MFAAWTGCCSAAYKRNAPDEHSDCNGERWSPGDSATCCPPENHKEVSECRDSLAFCVTESKGTF